ncbi:MAG TPA: tyrosine-type recombinase/integrase, partial [Saprospiraceae bacterium]|nr:tyrosine-type recombinase/integrase [Saprospiraceae bacterium]
MAASRLKSIHVSFRRKHPQLIYRFHEPVNIDGKMKIRHDETLHNLLSDNPEHRKLVNDIANRKRALVVARAKGVEDLIPGASSGMKFETFIKLFLTHRKGEVLAERRSQKTLDKDMETFKRWIEVMGSNYTVDLVNRRMVIKFRDILQSRRKKDGKFLSAGYINGYLRHLSAAWRWGYENEYVKENPFRMVSRVPENKKMKRIRVLEPDQVQAFRSWLARRPGWHLNAFNFALWTGCRVGEVFNAKHDDVHFKRVISGGDWQQRPFLAVPFKGRFRLVPLSERVLAIIESQRTAAADPGYLERFMTRTADGQQARIQQGYIFFEPTRPDSIKQMMTRASDGLKIKRSFHDLRHTFATEYLIRVFRETG